MKSGLWLWQNGSSGALAYWEHNTMFTAFEAGGALITAGSLAALSFSMADSAEKVSGANPVGFGVHVRKRGRGIAGTFTAFKTLSVRAD